MAKLNDIVERLENLANLYSFGGENVTNLELIIRDLKRIAKGGGRCLYRGS